MSWISLRLRWVCPLILSTRHFLRCRTWVTLIVLPWPGDPTTISTRSPPVPFSKSDRKVSMLASSMSLSLNSSGYCCPESESRAWVRLKGRCWGSCPCGLISLGSSSSVSENDSGDGEEGGGKLFLGIETLARVVLVLLGCLREGLCVIGVTGSCFPMWL